MNDLSFASLPCWRVFNKRFLISSLVYSHVQLVFVKFESHGKVANPDQILIIKK